MKRGIRIALIGISSLLLLIAIPILGVTTFILLKCPRQSIDVPVHDYTVDIDGLTEYYHTAGDPAKQPIVFLHGWGARPGERCSTDHVIAALAGHFYVVAPEHPGLIRSEAPKELWSYGEFAGALHRLLAFLELKNPIIMGQSFGGGVATAYVARYPSNVKSLILVDSNMTNEPRNTYWKAKQAWNRLSHKLLTSPLVPTPIKKLVINLYFGTPLRFINEETVVEKSFMSLINERLKSDKSLDLDYREIRTPTMLIWGDKDTFVTPLQRAKEIHKEIEGSKLIIVKGGHTVLFQRPKEIVDLIVSALSEL